MNNSLRYRIALTMVPGMGPVITRTLLEHLMPEDVFKEKESALQKIEGLGKKRAHAIRTFTDFERVENELRFIEKYKIKTFFITDDEYPTRLKNIYDAPVMLYYKGTANLNHSKIISIVGSRTHSDYGKYIIEKLVDSLKQTDIIIISGLAYGIDALAHQQALYNNIPTIGVLAHGLDNIYPAPHAHLAREMTLQGGLLTEFTSNTSPDKYNFPSRNRIVAGLSDATIIIETGIKGGSMITAELANGYNREVFAYPGKITDKKSAGCNYLIQTNKAILLNSTQQLLETMRWHTKPQATTAQMKLPLANLTQEEKMIVNLLERHSSLHIDEIHFHAKLSSSEIASAILNLEMQDIIHSLPGKMYKLS